MADYDDIADLIGLVYDAALEWQAWPATLNRLADLVGAVQVSLVTYDMSTHAAAGVAPRQDPDYMRSYAEYWWAACNPLWPRSAFAPIGALITPEMFIRREDYIRTDFVNEWASPHGMEVALGINVNLEGPTSTVLAVYRPYSRGDFDDRESAVQGARAASAPRRAITAAPVGDRARRGRVRRGAAPAASGRVAGRCRRQDRVCQPHRRGDPGRARRAALRRRRSARRKAGRDRPPAPADRPVLRSRGGARRGRRLDLDLAYARRHPLSLLVIPLRMGTAPLFIAGAAAIVFVTDPEREHPVREESLRRQFGLTPAEAAIAAAVLRGDGLTAAAAKLGVSVTTARTHLRQVFDKTNTRRQAELVRLILQGQGGIRER